MLTYFKDTDIDLLHQLDDRSLYQTCHSSKYLFQLCKQNPTLYDRMKFYHDFLVTLNVLNNPDFSRIYSKYEMIVYGAEGDINTIPGVTDIYRYIDNVIEFKLKGTNYDVYKALRQLVPNYDPYHVSFRFTMRGNYIVYQ